MLILVLVGVLFSKMVLKTGTTAKIIAIIAPLL
jgi:hypothetical protein